MKMYVRTPTLSTCGLQVQRFFLLSNTITHLDTRYLMVKIIAGNLTLVSNLEH